MSIYQFLVWLMGAGSSIAASWILERFGFFQRLSSDKKQMAFFLVCVLLSLSAYLVQTYVPAPVLEQVAPFFAIVSTAFGGIFIGTSFHKNSKKNDGLG